MENSVLRKRPREEQPQPLKTEDHAAACCLADVHSSAKGQRPSAPAQAVQGYPQGLRSVNGLCGSLQAGKEGGDYGAFASSSSSDFEGGIGKAAERTPRNGRVCEDGASRKGGVVVVKGSKVLGTVEENGAVGRAKEEAEGPPHATRALSSSMDVIAFGDDNEYHPANRDRRKSTARRSVARAASLVSTCPDLQAEDSCHSCNVEIQMSSFGDKWTPGGDELHDDLAVHGWSRRGWGDDQKADAMSGLWVFSNQGNSRVECHNPRDDGSWLSGPTDEKMKESDCSSPSKRQSSRLCDGGLGVKIGVIEEEEGGDERDVSGIRTDDLESFPSLQPGPDGFPVLQQECSAVAGIQMMDIEPSLCVGDEQQSSKADPDDDVISGTLSSAQESPNVLFKSSRNSHQKLGDGNKSKNPSVSSRRTDGGGGGEGAGSRQRTTASAAGDARGLATVEENGGHEDCDEDNSRLDPAGKSFVVVAPCGRGGKLGEGLDGALMAIVKEKPSVRRPRSRLLRDKLVLSGRESDGRHTSINEADLVAVVDEGVATCGDKNGHCAVHDSHQNGGDAGLDCPDKCEGGESGVALHGHDHVTESMQLNGSALGTTTPVVAAKSLGLGDAAAEIAASVSFMASNILALAENKESAGQNEALFLPKMGAPGGTGTPGEAGKESAILGPRHARIRSAISAGGSNSRVSGCSSGGDNDGGGVREREAGGVSSRSAVVALAAPGGNAAGLVGRGDVSSRLVKVGPLSQGMHEVYRLRTLARMPKHGDVMAVRSMCSRNLNLNPGIHVGDISAVLDSCSRSVSRALLKQGISAGRGHRGGPTTTVDLSESAALSRFTAGGNGRGGAGGFTGPKSSSEAGSSLSGSNDRAVGRIQVDVHLPSTATKGKTVLRNECSLQRQQELQKAALLVRALEEAGEVAPMTCGAVLKRKNGLAGAYRLQAMESKCNRLVVTPSEPGGVVPGVHTACSRARFKGDAGRLEGPETAGFKGNDGTASSHSKSAAAADAKDLAPRCEVHSTNNPDLYAAQHNADNENELQSQHRDVHHQALDHTQNGQVAAEQTRLPCQVANSTQSSRRSRTRPVQLLERAGVPIREPAGATGTDEVQPLATGTGVGAAAATSFSEWRRQTCSRASRRSMKTLARAKGRASRFGMVDDSCMVGNSQQLSSASSSAA
ncbi:hypothetical protein CBR_g6579 [Chara braunii]|uniref:Uncharacterized protein n=1 Tax=Chara braunii TaxID=69332 RepID=A0A388KK66_CHABU|nr:hypothetical protein CBR_g6579 [Chara braunii]|eukprot:GBG70451.1 hypothetical protein CBR_g6579 [Chara braunii]